MHRIGRSVEVRFRSKLSKSVILLIFYGVANLKKDSSRRAVWLGRHPAEKISAGPKDKLIQLGNLEKSAEAKACLTVFLKVRKAELKGGLSEPMWFFNGTH